MWLAAGDLFVDSLIRRMRRRAPVPLVAMAVLMVIPSTTTTSSSSSFRSEEICADGESTRICVPEGYMKFELPTEGEPTFVNIGVDIKDIPKVLHCKLQAAAPCYTAAKELRPDVV